MPRQGVEQQRRANPNLNRRSRRGFLSATMMLWRCGQNKGAETDCWRLKQKRRVREKPIQPRDGPSRSPTARGEIVVAPAAGPATHGPHRRDGRREGREGDGQRRVARGADGRRDGQGQRGAAGIRRPESGCKCEWALSILRMCLSLSLRLLLLRRP